MQYFNFILIIPSKIGLNTVQQRMKHRKLLQYPQLHLIQTLQTSFLPLLPSMKRLC